MLSLSLEAAMYRTYYMGETEIWTERGRGGSTIEGAFTWVVFETGDKYEMSWMLKDPGPEPLWGRNGWRGVSPGQVEGFGARLS